MMNKSFWRGALIMFLILASACEYKVARVTVWRGWVGWIADGLHELHGGEDHAGRDVDTE
jgi:hypothetical protein